MKTVQHSGVGRLDTAGRRLGGGVGSGAFSDSGIGTEYEKCPCGGCGHAWGWGYPGGDGDGDRYAAYYSENSDTLMGYGDCNTSGDQFGGGDTEDDTE